MRWAVFLDRDGVICEIPARPGDELVLLPGVADAIDALRAAGAFVFVVSNQPDVARGTLTRAALADQHVWLRLVLPVDDVRACLHDNGDCSCRKPKPGMLFDLADVWGVDLERSWLVGDRWVDIAAGHVAGVRTVLVDRPYSWEPTSAGLPPDGLTPDYRVADLSGAVAQIV